MCTMKCYSAIERLGTVILMIYMAWIYYQNNDNLLAELWKP